VAPPGILEEREGGATPTVHTIGRMSMSPIDFRRTHLCELFGRSPVFLREQVARFLDGVPAALVALGVQINSTLY
jgi:hypothetical protein